VTTLCGTTSVNFIQQFSSCHMGRYAETTICIAGTFTVNSTTMNNFQFLNIKLSPEMGHTSATGLVHSWSAVNATMWRNFLGALYSSSTQLLLKCKWYREWQGTICIVQPCSEHDHMLHDLDQWFLPQHCK